jgi:hypothetical protein
MISEKKQEIEQQLKRINGDIYNLNTNLVVLTNDFVTQLSISQGVDIDGVDTHSYLGDIAIKHNQTGRICTINFHNNTIERFYFQSIELHVNGEFNHTDQCFNIAQMIYKAIRDNNNIYLDYKNQINETLLKMSSKKQLDDVLCWALSLMTNVDREIKQDEIFYKGYHFSEQSRNVRSFNYEEIYVNGLNFSKNPTGTYSIQLLNHDKSIRAQSTRANEEVLMNLIKSFI